MILINIFSYVFLMVLQRNLLVDNVIERILLNDYTRRQKLESAIIHAIIENDQVNQGTNDTLASNLVFSIENPNSTATLSNTANEDNSVSFFYNGKILLEIEAKYD